jgi:hypothetical protein
MKCKRGVYNGNQMPNPELKLDVMATLRELIRMYHAQYNLRIETIDVRWINATSMTDHQACFVQDIQIVAKSS